MEDTYFNLEFTCRHILFRDKDSFFTIMNAKILNMESCGDYEKKNVIVKGTFERIEEKDSFRCYATWVDDRKYGKQINAAMPVMIASSDLDGIKRFLRRVIKGLGKVSAERIVDKYGVNTLDKIKESPDNISCIKGISKTKAKKIHETLLTSEKIESLTLYLFKNGVSSFNDVAAIYDKLGEDAQEKIMSNPYSICDYLSIRKLPLADKIALNTGVSALSKIRVSKIIQYYLTYHGYNSGDMYMVCDYLYKSLYSFAKKTGFYLENISEEYFGEILEYMQEMKTVVIEDISGERLIYLKAFYTIESNTAKLIKEINERKYSPLNPNTYDTFFAKLVANTGIVADETQKAAVRTAYENRFCVLTGGPGTGKTQTINTIIAFIESQKKTSKIVLCAPTGRAAKRMSELTGKDAYTIHRLLGIMGDDEYGNSYSYDLDADFVICDEASMIDAPLFYKLITAVADSKNASLLLVGDKDQLPPVGAGMPFKDIIESKKVPTVILEKLYRQASRSQINRNARLILAGVTQIGGGGLTFDKSLQDFFFFETGDVAFQRTLILKSIEQLLNVGTSMDDIMILSPVRKTALGVEEINKLVQNFINPLNNRVEFNTPLYSLRVKDRVMQTSNNYELGVFNGDIGVITSIDTKDEEITVSYDDSYIKDGVVQPGKKDVVYSFPLARELVLAYATTVHKSQGSEYPVAIMPLSPMFFNLSRNILYTAVTRAKKRCVLIGDRQSLINGIIKNDNTQRRTKLKERI